MQTHSDYFLDFIISGRYNGSASELIIFIQSTLWHLLAIQLIERYIP